MEIEKTKLKGVVLINPVVYDDSRGFFFESYNRSRLAKLGIEPDFTQDNHVKSSQGILRGLHYQKEPKAQAKLLRVTRGSIYDVVVDIRPGSSTYGEHIGVNLNSHDKKMIFVPEGFAHGYCTLEDDTEVLYKVTGEYAPDYEAGIIWNDETLNIQWPRLDKDYILSEKDKVLPTFQELGSPI